MGKPMPISRIRFDEQELDEIKLKKAPTFITGLDEITFGGLPMQRTTLLIGSAGSGKTIISMEYLINGALKANEPGVFLAFEENVEELAQNFANRGVDLNELIDKKLLSIEYVKLERSEIEETGEYDLEGLFVRLGYAIDSIGAKRVVIDTIEALFSGLKNEGILRAELRRLFRWMKSKAVTAIVTAERGEKTLSKYGLEEYVADCVIVLDNRMINQISTRRIRIVKYRGSMHGTNEYPFLIDKNSVDIMPITSSLLDHKVFNDSVSTGIKELDEMLGKNGYFCASTVLLTGTAGTGKTIFSGQFAYGACLRKERCLYFAFEESQEAIVRNMLSIGTDLTGCIRQGILKIEANRPTQYGLEMHLIQMHKLINEYEPSVVIIDPISNLTSAGVLGDVKAMLLRLVDFLKTRHITLLMTSFLVDRQGWDETEAGISSLADTWLELKYQEIEGLVIKKIKILKSRGMAHSNKTREFRITNQGIKIKEEET